MSNILRRIEIPILITAFCTIIQVVPYYVEIEPLNRTANTLQSWMLLIATMATFIGLISIAQVHRKRIQRRSDGWYFSIVVLVFMVIMAITGLPLENLGLGTQNPIYDFLFTNAMTPLSGTMYSILAFFIASAAYRAFRARNVEATIVLASGLFMIMSNAPLFTSSWGTFRDIGDWIFDVPNAATMRAVTIGVALGAIALAVRTLMGIERGYLRGGSEE